MMAGISPATFRRRRSVARLASVQALYEMEISGAASDGVLREFLTKRWKHFAEDAGLPPPDEAFLDRLVRGVSERQPELDREIESALSAEWSLPRLEVLLRVILRAGTYELLAVPEVPPKVVINEYVDVAHAFFSGKEIALVNAVLDRLAGRLRGGCQGGREERGGENKQTIEDSEDGPPDAEAE